MCGRAEINRRLLEMAPTWKRLAYSVQRRWSLTSDDAYQIVLDGTTTFLAHLAVDPLLILKDMQDNSLSHVLRSQLFNCINNCCRAHLRRERRDQRLPRHPTRVPLHDDMLITSAADFDDPREYLADAIERLPRLHQDVALLEMYDRRNKRAFCREHNLTRHKWNQLRQKTIDLLAKEIRFLAARRLSPTDPQPDDYLRSRLGG